MGCYSIRIIPLLLLGSVFISCAVDQLDDEFEAQSIDSLFDTFDGSLNLERTDIIATSGNNILKIVGN